MLKFKIKSHLLILVLVLLTISFQIVNAYKISPPNETVHQHITKEASEIWSNIPIEVQEHLDDSISDQINSWYNPEDNDSIVTGSGEEDLAPSTWGAIYFNHYWDPDEPRSGSYNYGLYGSAESSYNKAFNYWIDDVLPNYLGVKGNGEAHEVDVDKAYYYLGRAAHLLEDASQPSHVHNDIHLPTPLPSGDSILEEFTAQSDYYSPGELNFLHWDGNDFENSNKLINFKNNKEYWRLGL